MIIWEAIKDLDRYSWATIIIAIVLTIALCIDAFSDDEDENEDYQNKKYD